jgi:hypothetical protein
MQQIVRTLDFAKSLIALPQRRARMLSALPKIGLSCRQL